MTRTRTFLSIVVVAGAASILSAGPALAALWLEFTPVSAHAGQEVVVRTGSPESRQGALAGLDAGDDVDVYLRPTQADAQIARVDLGQLEVGEDGHGELTFVVPDVPPGPYEARVDCPACAPFSAGRSDLPAGSFAVLPSELASTGTPLVLGWLGLATVAFGIAIAHLNGRYQGERGLPA